VFEFESKGLYKIVWTEFTVQELKQ
jgi:hypothetical protein